jgi:hypothetical protein
MIDQAEKLIRNSTAEFLVFTGQAGEQSIETRYEDETIWLSQKLMAELFSVDVRTISEHLNNIYETGEIQRETTVREFRIVQTEGSREAARGAVFKSRFPVRPRRGIMSISQPLTLLLLRRSQPAKRV